MTFVFSCHEAILDTFAFARQALHTLKAIYDSFVVKLILCRAYGVVGNITAILHKQGPDGAFTPALSLLLRYSIIGSQVNQNAALYKDGIPAASAILRSNHTGWRQREAIQLLTELTKGNDAIKQAALKEGERSQNNSRSFCQPLL